MKEKKRKIIWKVNHGAGLVDVYLITLANNPQNLLEIISANLLLQKPLRRTCPMIVGICIGYEEAQELVGKIITEIYEQTGAFAVRQYLEL